MIVLTRLNGSRFAVNPDLVERVQASPDTTILMVDGARLVVTETLEEVTESIIGYRARVLAEAAAWMHTAPAASTTPAANTTPAPSTTGDSSEEAR